LKGELIIVRLFYLSTVFCLTDEGCIVRLKYKNSSLTTNQKGEKIKTQTHRKPKKTPKKAKKIKFCPVCQRKVKKLFLVFDSFEGKPIKVLVCYDCREVLGGDGPPCEACNNRKRHSVHHVYPQYYFDGAGPKRNLCRPCHDRVEKKIDKEERLNGRKALSKKKYIEIVDTFISEEQEKITEMRKNAYRLKRGEAKVSYAST